MAHATNHDRVTRDQTINIRATSRQRDLIDHAAAIAGKSRSDFMLDAASAAAEAALYDRTTFVLDPEEFDRLLDLIENPPEPSAELRRLLREPAPWD